MFSSGCPEHSAAAEWGLLFLFVLSFSGKGVGRGSCQWGSWKIFHFSETGSSSANWIWTLIFIICLYLHAQGVEPGDETTLHILMSSADGKGWCRMKCYAQPERFHVSAQGNASWRGNQKCSRLPQCLPTGVVEQQSGPWTSTNSQALIPALRKGPHRAARLSPVSEQRGTGPSAGLAGGSKRDTSRAGVIRCKLHTPACVAVSQQIMSWPIEGAI